IAQNALESAAKNGVDVDEIALKKSVDYQMSNVSEDQKTVNPADGAGVLLYSVSSIGRASAETTKSIKTRLAKAKKEGKIQTDSLTMVNMMDAGYTQTEALKNQTYINANSTAMNMSQKDDVMRGFGSNGGEEYYSYLQT